MAIGNGIGIPLGGGVNWSKYWDARYIDYLSVISDSDTEQTITADIVGSGYSGVSYEYSTNLSTWTVHGTSATGTYNATGLTSGTTYYWRARLYRGTQYGNYSNIGIANTFYDSTVTYFTNSGIVDGTTYFGGTTYEITGLNLKRAVDKLVKDLNVNSMTAKVLVFYPLIGSTYNTAKLNLINPLDSDAAYRLEEIVAPVYDGKGITGNSSGLNTNIIPATVGGAYNNFSIGILSSGTQTQGRYLFGVIDDSGDVDYRLYFIPNFDGVKRIMDIPCNTGNRKTPAYNAAEDGIWQWHVVSNVLRYAINGQLTTIKDPIAAANMPTLSCFLLGDNTEGVLNNTTAATISQFYWAINMTLADNYIICRSMNQLQIDMKRSTMGVMRFYGDSITRGYGATNIFTERWSYLVAKNKGYFEDNHGVDASPLQLSNPVYGKSLESIYTSIEYDTLTQYIFLAFGINDVRLADLTANGYGTKLDQILDHLINKKSIPAGKIVLLNLTCTVNYGAGDATKYNAINALITTKAALYGCQCIDVLTYLNNNGGIAVNTIIDDGLHLNTVGHDNVADCIIANLV